jgi:hypothetical protein
MPSPFPGMDPYLEGRLWSDVHHRLATEISRRLTPRLRPRYVARIEVAIIQDVSYASEITIAYPDVAVPRSKHANVLHDGREATGGYNAHATVTPWGTIPPAPLVMEAPEAFRFKQATVEVRRADDNQLITAIEIISPANKREPGLFDYRQKRTRLYQSGVHLLEIDLIRRGVRPTRLPKLPQTSYLVTLTRSHARMIELWPMLLQDPLPLLPVPLSAPDLDVPLELDEVLATIYDEAAYDLSIDYSAPPPPPPLSDEDAAWLQTILDRSNTP